MRKLVIANSGIAQIGKTASIIAVYQLLKGQCFRLLGEEWQNGDIKAIFEVNGVKVGIESQGDPYCSMEKTMEEFVKLGCDIIVTSCRTKGGTYDKVTEYLSKNNGYDILWAAHYVYQISNAGNARALLNARYAQQVYQLIIDRINGVI